MVLQYKRNSFFSGQCFSIAMLLATLVFQYLPQSHSLAGFLEKYGGIMYLYQLEKLLAVLLMKRFSIARRREI